MKKIIISASALFMFSTPVFSQNTRGNYGYSDRYTVSYYAPLLWGANGFRSVEEENRIMEEINAEHRRQAHLDSMSSARMEEERRLREMKEEIKQDQIEARKQKEQEKAKAKKP